MSVVATQAADLGLWTAEGMWLYDPTGNPVAEGVGLNRDARTAVMQRVADALNAAKALLDQIDDNPTLFFGMEDTCQDEFDDLRRALERIAA